MTGSATTLARRRLLAAAAVFVAAPGMSFAAAGPRIEAWRSPGCGCCEGWADHLRLAGYGVTLYDAPNLGAVRARLGVPPDLAGCHTARVGGYVVEGHVPAAAVRRLLAGRPDLGGIAVPGMPAASPGMVPEGEPVTGFDVIAFRADGSRSVFMRF